MKQADELKNTDSNEENGIQANGTPAKLNDEEQDHVAGGSSKYLVLRRINHCSNPGGRCKKSKHEDKKHVWCSYNDVYVCDYCDQWVYPSEM